MGRAKGGQRRARGGEGGAGGGKLTMRAFLTHNAYSPTVNVHVDGGSTAERRLAQRIVGHVGNAMNKSARGFEQVGARLPVQRCAEPHGRQPCPKQGAAKERLSVIGSIGHKRSGGSFSPVTTELL